MMWNSTLHSMMSARANGLSRSIHHCRDGAGLLDLLLVTHGPMVHRVVLVDDEIGIPRLGQGGGHLSGSSRPAMTNAHTW